MASIKNFKNNDKYSDHNYDIYNPEFSNNISAMGEKEEDGFGGNLHKWVDFLSWAR